MKEKRSDANATTPNSSVYITGGFNGDAIMNSAEVYNPEVNQWSFAGEMVFRRSNVSCIANHSYM
jgi:kelch-like protein 10